MLCTFGSELARQKTAIRRMMNYGVVHKDMQMRLNVLEACEETSAPCEHMSRDEFLRYIIGADPDYHLEEYYYLGTTIGIKNPREVYIKAVRRDLGRVILLILVEQIVNYL